MKTLHSLGALVAPPARAVTARNTPAWRWGLALALVGALSPPAFAQTTYSQYLEINGNDPTQTNQQATLMLHHHGVLAHQLRYTAGTLYLEGAGNGYGTNNVPNFVVGGRLNAGAMVTSSHYIGSAPGAGTAFTAVGNWGGGPTPPLAKIVATDTGVGESGVEFNRKRGALDFDLLNVHYQGQSQLLVRNTGNIGIGTSDPASLLEARRDAAGQVQLLTLTNRAATSAGTGTAIAFRGYRDVDPNYETGRIALMHVGGTAGDAAQFAHMIFSVRGFNDGPPQERMRITPGGNVLIAKTSQANGVYKLDVGGSVRANEVVVNTNGADFVFEKGYNLMPLPAVEAYIRAHHHLPEVASAADMQARGAAVGEVQTKLLQKVEELTLHLIEQNKRLDRLEAENQALKTAQPHEAK
ncbi:hypothetical protein [Hymenobacter sp.]|uniref:hypothetical protein n=1 Tax=Hymenobacter sp. TaxID=1898978 RepID=UPI00286B3D87|nr:hypothetical protein [Hymenobacter sp.]